MPPKIVKAPNVAPKLSTLSEQMRIARLQEMMRVHEFTTTIIGEISRYDEVRRFGSVDEILTRVYYNNYTSLNRNRAVRAVEGDFAFFRNRAGADMASLQTLETEIKGAHIQEREFLERVSASHLGRAIVVRHVDLGAALSGTATFNPVANGLRRGSSYSNPTVNADPYTTSQTDEMRQHIRQVINGLTIAEISDTIGAAMDVQTHRQAYWGGIVAAYGEYQQPS